MSWSVDYGDLIELVRRRFGVSLGRIRLRGLGPRSALVGRAA